MRPGLVPGQIIEVTVHKEDGKIFRQWNATVESVADEIITTTAGPGNEVRGPGGGWVYRYYDRVTYWLDRPYNLGEIYRANGKLVEIYLHVASVPTLTRDGIAFTDYELDVVKHPGRPAEIVDQDEFEEAAGLYGYSPEFQARCYRIAAEAAELADRWVPGEPPTQR